MPGPGPRRSGSTHSVTASGGCPKKCRFSIGVTHFPREKLSRETENDTRLGAGKLSTSHKHPVVVRPHKRPGPRKHPRRRALQARTSHPPKQTQPTTHPQNRNTTSGPTAPTSIPGETENPRRTSELVFRGLPGSSNALHLNRFRQSRENRVDSFSTRFSSPYTVWDSNPEPID